MSQPPETAARALLAIVSDLIRRVDASEHIDLDGKRERFVQAVERVREVAELRPAR